MTPNHVRPKRILLIPADDMDVQLLNHVANGGKIDFLCTTFSFKEPPNDATEPGDFQLLLLIQVTEFNVIGLRNQDDPGQTGISVQTDVA